MRDPIRPWRRSLSAALAALHLALALGAGGHRGPHLESGLAELPEDLHHHAYGFAVASGGDRPAADLCVACQLSRLGLRFTPPLTASVDPPAAVDQTPERPFVQPARVDLAALAPRAPPRA